MHWSAKALPSIRVLTNIFEFDCLILFRLNFYINENDGVLAGVPPHYPIQKESLCSLKKQMSIISIRLRQDLRRKKIENF